MKSSECILSDLRSGLLDDNVLDNILKDSKLCVKDEVNNLRVVVADFLVSQIKPETIKSNGDFKLVLERLRAKHAESMFHAFL